MRVPDTNTPASSNTQLQQQQQQQRSTKSNQLSSEYSLFELETFFTRWAPDNDSAVAPIATSCSFTSDDSAECDQNGVIIVDTQLQPQHVLQSPQGSASSALRSGGQSSQGFPSVSSTPRVDIQQTVSHSKWLSCAFFSDIAARWFCNDLSSAFSDHLHSKPAQFEQQFQLCFSVVAFHPHKDALQSG